MITLEDGVLVLNRLADGEDIQPVLQRARGKRAEAWFILIRVETEAVLHWLLDIEIMDDDVPLRYVARNGEAGDATAKIDELVTAEEGTQCRLKGMGAAPAALVGDEPEEV
ncbi:MAG: hypothetical protein BWY76_00426 [bacterium ADurb.Bin429]|nr:MAG: hypothetical protein BWY76_00426 [bacterium ADurb.Bin429]